MISESEKPHKRIIPNFHPLLPIPPIGLHVDDEKLYEFNPIEREMFLQNIQKRLTQLRLQAATHNKLNTVKQSPQTAKADEWDNLETVSKPIIGTLSSRKQKM